MIETHIIMTGKVFMGLSVFLLLSLFISAIRRRSRIVWGLMEMTLREIYKHMISIAAYGWIISILYMIAALFSLALVSAIDGCPTPISLTIK